MKPLSDNAKATMPKPLHRATIMTQPKNGHHGEATTLKPLSCRSHYAEAIMLIDRGATLQSLFTNPKKVKTKGSMVINALCHTSHAPVASPYCSHHADDIMLPGFLSVQVLVLKHYTVKDLISLHNYNP